MNWIQRILIALLTTFCGCTSAPVGGLIFTYSSQHVYGKSAGGQIGPGRAIKQGQSCSWSAAFVYLVYYGGGGSIGEAMKDGEISRIATVDRKSLNILLDLVQRECVVVTGE